MNDLMLEVSCQMVWFLPLLGVITFHVIAQGYAAWYFGDKTAKTLGRLSINPLKHVDLIGTILVPALTWIVFQVPFGWAKRLPISKKMLGHPKEMLVVALVGPISNMLQAVIWLSLDHYWKVFEMGRISWLADAIGYGVQMNIAYAIINMIPIPPLDAHHILESMMPRRFLSTYRKLGQVGLMVIAVLIISGKFRWIGSHAVPEIALWLEYSLKCWVWY